MSSMSRRAPTPVRSTPSEAMAASQQSHINELVQKNRTLEHTAKRLQDTLALEQSRAKDAVAHIQAQWHAERAAWREGCDTLQACHRIVQLRTALELDQERMRVLREQDAARAERIAVLQRDFRITMFQVKEGELEGRVAELEEELEEVVMKGAEDMGEIVKQYHGILGKQKARYKVLTEEVKARADEVVAAQKERDDLQVCFIVRWLIYY